MLSPDAIPAVTEPRFAATDWLGDADRVVALAIDGDARAYPIRILNWHEIVDDVVGGVPVAVTFCPLCGTGIAYERRLADGAVLTFKVSGRLYKNDLVMYDAESGPGSWWPQILGEAITGPYHGTKLRLATSTTLPWGEFKARFPDGKLLERPVWPDGQYMRDYDADPYAGYPGSTAVWFEQGYVDTTTGFHPKEFVLSVQIDGRAKIYPHRSLETERVVNDEVNGVPVVVTYAQGTAQAFERGAHTFRHDGDKMVDEVGGRWDPLTGFGAASALPPVPAVNGFWFAIFDFEMERAGFVDVYGVGLIGEEGARRPGGGSSIPYLAAGVAVVLGLGWYVSRRARAGHGGTGGGRLRPSADDVRPPPQPPR
ncbi:MAG: DUF3179 domain-containing protein [Euryarchaeota archaeon]|nr:DUF3179 domain-containing protein [Euryarchaeota archaeon]